MTLIPSDEVWFVSQQTIPAFFSNLKKEEVDRQKMKTFSTVWVWFVSQ
jgi:uroporphyrinogen-III synthase